MAAYRSRFVLLLAATVLAACGAKPQSSNSHTGSRYVDAGDTGPDDGGAPVCTVNCGFPDAGTDAGYVPQPFSVDQVIPDQAERAGGAVVTLLGKGFVNAFTASAADATAFSKVFFGSNPAFSYRVLDDTTLEATVPPNPAGPVDVRVENPNGKATCAQCLRMFEALQASVLSPQSGSTLGGDTITLDGAGLSADAVVLVGGSSSPKVALVSSSRLTFLTPPGAAGPADVMVFNKNGWALLQRAFTYSDPLKVDHLQPAGGPLAGGNVVDLVGTGLSGVSSVSVGGQPAVFAVVSSTLLRVTLPARALPGLVDVAAATPSSTDTLAGGYAYFDGAMPGLALAGVVPSHGPAVGGNAVHLFGSGFAASMAVGFSGTAAAVTVLSANEALATVASPGAALAANTQVDLVATLGAASATLAKAYHFNVDLVSISPTSGSSAGGQPVSLAGNGFVAGMQVFFGPLQASSATVASATRIDAVLPPGTAGPCEVRVQDAADAQNRATLPNAFLYAEDLSLSRVSPASGAVAGGQLVTLYGTGFAAGMVAKLGGAFAKDLSVLDSHRLVARIPPGNVGAVDVEVILGSKNALLKGGFTYVDPKNINGGSSGAALAGTLNITVLDGSRTQYGAPVQGAFVILGTDSATPFQGLTDLRGQITFSDPSLVKAQQVTVTKKNYEAATAARQEQQNLTLFIAPNGGGTPSPGAGKPPPPSIISGKVVGFKAPRPLHAGESEEAHVFLAPHTLYDCPPFANPPQLGASQIVKQDGGKFSLFTRQGMWAIYAVYGISDGTIFTPYLMGVHRGIQADPAAPATGMDIVLDMHLDMKVPATVNTPPTEAAGLPAMLTLYAYMDLGGDGVVPFDPRSGTQAKINYDGLPQLDGSGLLWLIKGEDSGTGTVSFFFRRQLGDLSTGLTIGPMLGLLHITQPSGTSAPFTPNLAWDPNGGPTPDLITASVALPTLFGPVPVWNLVLPGSDRQITLPQVVVDDIKGRFPPGTQLYFIVNSSRSPRFDFHYWNYDQAPAGPYISPSWTSFAEAMSLIQL